MSIARHLTVLLICLLQGAMPLLADTPALAALPKLHSGVPAYPRAVHGGRPHAVPHSLPWPARPSTSRPTSAIRRAFPDSWTRRSGRSAIRAIAISPIWTSPMTRRNSACWFACPIPSGARRGPMRPSRPTHLAADDVFEVLIDPRDDQGRSKGPVYRIVGNAGGVCKIDRDLPQIGQPHQPWQAGVKCGSMMWDPMGSWMAAVQIPFHDLGGPPKDGDVVGLPGRDPLRRSEDHRRALAGRRLRGPLALRPRAFRRRGGGPIIAAIGSARTRSSTGPFASAASSATAATSRHGSTGA